MFNYAGNEFYSVLDNAKRFGLEEILNNFGRVDRCKSLEIQRSSHPLVLVSWNTSTEKGVVTGKLLEYMMMGKPVIGLISGEVAGSEVKQIIKACNIGEVYEEAISHKDLNRLKQYLLFQYNNYREKRDIYYLPNQAAIDTFAYSKIVNRLVKLFEDT